MPGGIAAANVRARPIAKASSAFISDRALDVDVGACLIFDLR